MNQHNEAGIDLDSLTRYDHRGALMVPDQTGDYLEIGDVRNLLARRAPAPDWRGPVGELLSALASYEIARNSQPDQKQGAAAALIAARKRVESLMDGRAPAPADATDERALFEAWLTQDEPRDGPVVLDQATRNFGLTVWQARAALDHQAAPAPGPADARPGKITITLRQAHKLVESFGGHDVSVTVTPPLPDWEQQMPGLYAYCTDYPEDGADYLGPTEVDDDLMILGERGMQARAALANNAAPADERRNIAEVTRTSDMGLTLRFMSARSCSAFENWLNSHQVAPAQPSAAPRVTLPRVLGVSRDAESPGFKGVLVSFSGPLSDDQLRALHDLLSSLAAPTSDQQAGAVARTERDGWSAAAKALAERAAGHDRMGNWTEADECRQCVSMLHDMKPAAAPAAIEQAGAPSATRAADLEREIESLRIQLHAAEQAGAQPVAQDDLESKTMDEAISAGIARGRREEAADWAECERIANLPAVDEVLRGFSEDPTGDTGTMVVRAVLESLAAPTPATDQPEEPPSAKQEKLRALADRIDHEKSWKLPFMDHHKLTADQKDRLDCGIMLRRYADLLAPGRWLVLPPTGNVQFSASTLEKVAEMAKRAQDRRAATHVTDQAADQGGA